MDLPNNISLLYAVGALGLVAPQSSALIGFSNCVFMSLKHYSELLNHLFFEDGDIAQLVVSRTLVCKAMEAGRL